MTRSRRGRGVDHDPSWSRPEPVPEPVVNRTFRLSDQQRQQIARHLRYIDRARHALEAQHNAENREIIRELRDSADRIFDLLNSLEEGD
jgi:hypothetical protein